MRYYYVSWSPKTGEATYTKGFATAEEREKYIWLIGSKKSIQTWEADLTPPTR